MGRLVLENVTKTYGDNTVVDKISFVVEEGEMLTIVGPSGCGKTTTLRMISGLTMPSGGKITVDDKVLVDMEGGVKPLEPEERDFGMVFQSYAVWPHMNVFDNVAYPLKIRKLPKNEIRERTLETLSLVHLDGYEERMAFQLSGGQQQRIALARALVMHPRLLLLDEPLSNLDAALREEMRGEIKEIQKKTGITVINVTHDQVEAMTMSDKVAVMKLGELIQYDSPYNLYEHPVNTFVAKFIGSAIILPATKAADAAPDAEGKMEVTVNGTYKIKVPFVESSKTEGFIAARSHHIHPQTEGDGMEVKVSRRLYQGSFVEYYLLAEGCEELIRMQAPVTFDAEEGHNTRITISKAIWLDE